MPSWRGKGKRAFQFVLKELVSGMVILYFIFIYTNYIYRYIKTSPIKLDVPNDYFKLILMNYVKSFLVYNVCISIPALSINKMY